MSLPLWLHAVDLFVSSSVHHPSPVMRLVEFGRCQCHRIEWQNAIDCTESGATTFAERKERENYRKLQGIWWISPQCFMYFRLFGILLAFHESECFFSVSPRRWDWVRGARGTTMMSAHKSLFQSHCNEIWQTIVGIRFNKIIPFVSEHMRISELSMDDPVCAHCSGTFWLDNLLKRSSFNHMQIPEIPLDQVESGEINSNRLGNSVKVVFE